MGFTDQIKGSVGKVNDAFDPGGREGAQVTAKEYDNAASKFVSERKGGYTERLMGKALTTNYENNVNYRTQAFTKAFKDGGPEKQLMADCIVKGQSYGTFCQRLGELREGQ